MRKIRELPITFCETEAEAEYRRPPADPTKPNEHITSTSGINKGVNPKYGGAINELIGKKCH